jgi:hypothetical protein
MGRSVSADVDTGTLQASTIDLRPRALLRGANGAGRSASDMVCSEARTGASCPIICEEGRGYASRSDQRPSRHWLSSVMDTSADPRLSLPRRRSMTKKLSNVNKRYECPSCQLPAVPLIPRGINDDTLGVIMLLRNIVRPFTKRPDCSRQCLPGHYAKSCDSGPATDLLTEMSRLLHPWHARRSRWSRPAAALH